MIPEMDSLLASLDGQQRAAVYASGRLIRVRSGAGSGKSRCIAARVAHLLSTGVPAAVILVVTFSKRAGEELQHRLGSFGQGVIVGTIHSLGYRITRQTIGFLKPVDSAGQKRLLRKALIEIKSPRKFAEVFHAINQAKSNDWDIPVAFRAEYDAYQRLLYADRLCDFNDMILRPVQWFVKHPEGEAQWRNAYQHVLVDEAQDTSALQWRLLWHIIGEQTHLFVTGDCQQAIYNFRGARPDLMMEGADKKFGGMADYPLATNYRSLSPVVTLANRSMAGREWSLEMQSHREGEKPIVFLGPHPSPFREGETIVGHLQQLHAQGYGWGSMAVLYRTNAQSEPIESAMIRAGVPNIVVGDIGFYARMEVLDCLAYLKVAVGFDAEALGRIYNRPARYIGKAWLEELERQGGWEAFWTRYGSLAWSKSHMRGGAKRLFDDVSALRAHHADGAPPAVILRHAIEVIGYRRHLLGDEPDEMDNLRGENLDQLIASAARWTSPQEFLAFADSCQQRKSDVLDAFNRVQLSTVHRAKGLEWPVVVVAGLTKGKLPHVSGCAKEERRILYVAVTRAQDHLILSGCHPVSEFWHELMQAPNEASLLDEEMDDGTLGTPPGRGQSRAGGAGPGGAGGNGGTHVAARGDGATGAGAGLRAPGYGV